MGSSEDFPMRLVCVSVDEWGRPSFSMGGTILSAGGLHRTSQRKGEFVLDLGHSSSALVFCLFYSFFKFLCVWMFHLQVCLYTTCILGAPRSLVLYPLQQ